MKIYLLRHTSLDIEPDIFYGQSDIDVSSNFESEVRNIKSKIEEYKIIEDKIKIYSSPLKRCVKLATALFEGFTTDDRLKELNFGDWENKRIKNIPNELIESWRKDIMNFKIPNGESNDDFFLRLKSFCDQIIKQDNNIFIVAHAGSINCIISYLANIPFDKLVIENWKKIGYGSLSRLVKKNKEFNLDLFGV
jgi:alpha-ribazole phosphatase